MAGPDKPVSLRSWLNPEILHVEQPKFPTLYFLNSLIVSNTRGKDGPLQITLRPELFNKFHNELAETFLEIGEMPIFYEKREGPHTGIFLHGVPIDSHQGDEAVILKLPDYGVLK